MKFLKFVLSAKRLKRARGATLHSHHSQTMAAFSLWPEGAPGLWVCCVHVVQTLSRSLKPEPAFELNWDQL